MNGISFIGMAGSGKSTIGQKVAERLDWRFVDLDEHIHAVYGVSHAKLEAQGNQTLLNIEEEETLKLNLNDTVFAPGGSIIYAPHAMEKVQQETTVIHIEVPLNEIARRLQGLLEGRGIVGLREKGLAGVYAERLPLYQRQAHFTIPCDTMQEAEILEKVLETLRTARAELHHILR